MDEAELKELEENPESYDYVMILLIRELLSFDQVSEIAQKESTKIVKTKQGTVLRLQGQTRHRITVELGLTQSKVPRVYLFRLREFVNIDNPVLGGATKERFVDLTQEDGDNPDDHTTA